MQIRHLYNLDASLTTVQQLQQTLCPLNPQPGGRRDKPDRQAGMAGWQAQHGKLDRAQAPNPLSLARSDGPSSGCVACSRRLAMQLQWLSEVYSTGIEVQVEVFIRLILSSNPKISRHLDRGHTANQEPIIPLEITLRNSPKTIKKVTYFTVVKLTDMTLR